MATNVWNGFLSIAASFKIPVYLNVAARDQKVELNTFHKPCYGPVRMRKFCPQCEKMLQPDDIIHGYKIGDGIIPITDEELKAITPATDRAIKITEFVSVIDPVYLAESFYLLPDVAGEKDYALLVKTMRDASYVAIAQITHNKREHVVVLRPKDNGLILHYLWYSREINRVPEFESLKMPAFTPAETKSLNQWIENLKGEFIPDKFEDGYYQRLNTLIASKSGSKIPAPVPLKAFAVSASGS